MNTLSTSSSVPARYPFAVDYTSLLSNLSEEPEAEGAYSHVYQCQLKGKLVAVKQLRRPSPDHPPIIEIAQKEYHVWHRLRHPNILPLEGICFLSEDSEERVPSFISTWQRNGRIKDFVKNRPEADFLCLIEGIASAVVYLHDNGIIHGDLRAANVLISDRHEAVLTDFGIAKHDYGNGVTASTNLQGNYRWMACEFFRSGPGHARRSRASDVWMFAILIQEILSGNIPFYAHKNDSFLELLVQGTSPQFPSAQHSTWKQHDEPVRGLASRCCAQEPNDRPPMSVVLDSIRAMRSSKQDNARTAGEDTFNRSVTAPAGTTLSSDDSSNAAPDAGETTINIRDLMHTLNIHGGSTSSSSEPSTTRASIGASAVSKNASFSTASEPQTDPYGSTSTSTETERGSLGHLRDAMDDSDDDERWSVCPAVELNNLINRKGLSSRLVDEYEPWGPGERRAWYCIYKLDGREIVRAHGVQKTKAKKAAAKIILTKLRANKGTTAPVRDAEATSCAPETSSTPTSGSFRSECLNNKLRWVYTLCNAGKVYEGRGKSQIEARQDARLQIALAASSR